jgi:hypothetical protein
MGHWMEGVVSDPGARKKGLESDQVLSQAWKISTCYCQVVYVEEGVASAHRWDYSCGGDRYLEGEEEHEKIVEGNDEVTVVALVEVVVRT